MPATAVVRELNGAGPTPTTLIAARFKTADDPVVDFTNPIPIPAAGTNRSFWKSHELRFSGVFGSISNVVIFSDGGGFIGVTTFVGDETITPAAYQQASGTVGVDGDEIVATHGGITAKTDLFNFTTGAPKTVDAGPIVASPSSSNHVVLQMDVPSTVSQGDLADETLTWRYDEI